MFRSNSVRPRASRWRRNLVAATALTATWLGGCGPAEPAAPDATAAEAAPGVRVVTVDHARRMLDGREVVLLDVRTSEEFAGGHLAGASNLDSAARDFRDRLAELPREASYVIYCRSGNRSAQARAVMEELGFTDVADIEGGILAWADAGLPIEG